MIKECNANELKEKLDAKENFQFIDCRELAEWDEAHIAGASLLPLSEFETKYEKVLTDKNAEIIEANASFRALFLLVSKA